MARIFAVNTSDRERMRMLLDPVVSVDGAAGRMEQPAPVAREEGGVVGPDVVDLSWPTSLRRAYP